MATANDLTRQQLDELDALLQRMLNVPATKVESSPPVVTPEPPSGWRVDPPASVAVPHLLPTLPDLPRVMQSVELQALGTAPQPFVPTPILPLERSKVPPFVPAPPEVDVPPLPEEFAALDLAELTPAPKPSLDLQQVAKQPALSPILWPLFGMNWILESILKLFGPPGELMTQRLGKNLLGTAGLLMLIGAGLWAVQGQGWIKLPIGR